MKIKAVIGANWGDEGKGLMTSHFASSSAYVSDKTIVVCTNGGSQHGHTVVTPSKVRHVFHHFGAGTFSGADTYLPKDFIVNPMSFMKELKELNALGYKPNVYVHPSCVWSTPYDMFINQIVEEAKGDKKHGSCGMGIWETIVRTYSSTPTEFNSCCRIKDVNMCSPVVIKEFLEKIRDKYVPLRLKGIDVSSEWKRLINSQGILYHFMKDLYAFLSYVKISDTCVLNKYDTVIFENAQGLMLDTKYSNDVEHSTPSNTGVKNIEKNIIGSGLKYDDIEICYVSRTYATRHGIGYLPKECSASKLTSGLEDLTNLHNEFQGDLRYGHLDYDTMLNRIKKDYSSLSYNIGKNCHCSIAFTHTNELPISNIDRILAGFDSVYSSDNEINLKKVK